MPATEMVCWGIALLPVSVRDPETKELSTGVKVTGRAQVAPAATDMQPGPTTMEGTEETAEEICNAALPQLVMFRLTVEDVPTSTGPKLSEGGARQTEGARVARSSLAMKLWM